MCCRLAFFGGVAPVFPAFGIYGLISFFAANRTREAGISGSAGPASDFICPRPTCAPHRPRTTWPCSVRRRQLRRLPGRRRPYERSTRNAHSRYAIGVAGASPEGSMLATFLREYDKVSSAPVAPYYEALDMMTSVTCHLSRLCSVLRYHWLAVGLRRWLTSNSR